jgi:hypothetical protein
LQIFTSIFVGGWMGFFTSPEVLQYGMLWNHYPSGMWVYRWGDQQFWKTAVGLFDDGSHIEDVSYVGKEPIGIELEDGPKKNYIDILHHG